MIGPGMTPGARFPEVTPDQRTLDEDTRVHCSRVAGLLEGADASSSRMASSLFGQLSILDETTSETLGAVEGTVISALEGGATYVIAPSVGHRLWSDLSVTSSYVD